MSRLFLLSKILILAKPQLCTITSLKYAAVTYHSLLQDITTKRSSHSLIYSNSTLTHHLSPKKPA